MSEDSCLLGCDAAVCGDVLRKCTALIFRGQDAQEEYSPPDS